MNINDLCNAVNGSFLKRKGLSEVTYLEIDSRKRTSPHSVFFALKSSTNDGHKYLKDAFDQGVRNFVVSEQDKYGFLEESNIVLVGNTLAALQKLATAHRNEFSIPVLGITGSYGKTIIKEWLYELLNGEFSIVKSPKSYNSQIGVPLSVWQMRSGHELAILEAGISSTYEMKNLEKIIKPTIGMFTNIGEAHKDGFNNINEKIREKLILFKDCKTLIYCKDHRSIDHEIISNEDLNSKAFTWSLNDIGHLNFNLTKRVNETLVEWEHNSKTIHLDLPFTDSSSIENALHCIAFIEVLGLSATDMQAQFSNLSALPLRLQLSSGRHGSVIINDTYTADLDSLKIALEFQNEQQKGLVKTVFLSHFNQHNSTTEKYLSEINSLMLDHGVEHFIGIGEAYKLHSSIFENIPITNFYSGIDEFRQKVSSLSLSKRNILFKGSRKSGLDGVVPLFEEKSHDSVLEINLNQLIKNLKVYKQLLNKETKVMAMVKALSYGAGSHEIALTLQQTSVNYLTVAYVDEGIQLRNNGVKLPIMVMNPGKDSLFLLQHYRLEPEIYSISNLKKIVDFIEQSPLDDEIKIHLKIETGMHRLGFNMYEIPKLAETLKSSYGVEVASVFSHLASAELESDDEFTKLQVERLNQAYNLISEVIGYKPIKHVLNSSGIIRFPEYQFDMVRLGIGLYGFDQTNSIQNQLELVSCLKSTISQCKIVEAGETVGYNRKGVVNNKLKVATVGLGYADGISRKLSNGVGSVLVRGVSCPTIGNICMDLLMIDVTNVPDVKENDEVILFQNTEQLIEMAVKCETIPYEILTGIAGRVKRIFIKD